MTPTGWNAAETGADAALPGLLALYGAERRLYGEILALSRRQGELLRAGATLTEIRGLLQEKRDRLDEIARLEQEHAASRALWAANRHGWRGGAAAALHQALREVGALIEQILEVEERNDRLLLAETGV